MGLRQERVDLSRPVFETDRMSSAPIPNTLTGFIVEVSDFDQTRIPNRHIEMSPLCVVESHVGGTRKIRGMADLPGHQGDP